MANYSYQCPICGTQLEFRQRVTVNKRRCPQCGTEVTPYEIDRQGYRRTEAKRQQAFYQLVGCAFLVLVLGGLAIAVSFIQAPQGPQATVKPDPPTANTQPTTTPPKTNPRPTDKPDPDRFDPPEPVAVEIGPAPRLIRDLLPPVLILKTGSPVRPGVDAWVEVDGERRAKWLVSTVELRLNLTPGKHRIAVHSIYNNRKSVIFDDVVELNYEETRSITISP